MAGEFSRATLNPMVVMPRSINAAHTALVAMVAHTGDPELPIVRWDNPVLDAMVANGAQWHDDEIGVACCIMSLVTAVRQNAAPSYGAAQARLDQEIILAIRQSSLDGGRPVRLPLDPGLQAV